MLSLRATKAPATPALESRETLLAPAALLKLRKGALVVAPPKLTLARTTPLAS